LSWLGNGWLYAGVAVTVLVGADSMSVIWRPLLSVVVLHLIYRPLKLWLSRPRPYQAYPDLKPLLPALDEYSCPSGHAMTLTAVLITLPATNGILTLVYLLLWTAMAWARVAVAHHYPSDILAGSALAAIVALPISTV